MLEDYWIGYKMDYRIKIKENKKAKKGLHILAGLAWEICHLSPVVHGRWPSSPL